MKIAVIGSGISGLSAAWLLHQEYNVHLFEKNDYLGGHAHTVDVPYSGKQPIAVDTGFMVFNYRTYPNFIKLLEYLHIEVEKSDMSFGVSLPEESIEYSGKSLQGLFAQRKNMVSLKFWRMLYDILYFNKTVGKRIIPIDITLEALLAQMSVSDSFKNYYLLPMAGSIWSCAPQEILKYPARTFINFFQNHGLLEIINQPQWYTIKGGSRLYIEAMTASLKDKVHLGTAVTRIQRQGNNIKVKTAQGKVHTFDQVVIATHPDEALKLLEEPSPDEQKILNSFQYISNKVVLHTDTNAMPKNRNCWSSWVYIQDAHTKKSSVTYWLNSLQNVDPHYPLFISINPCQTLDPSKVLRTFDYAHPLYDMEALKAQGDLRRIQGKNSTWYCGAYHGYGFHEDGLKAGLEVSNLLGVSAPWQ